MKLILMNKMIVSQFTNRLLHITYENNDSEVHNNNGGGDKELSLRKYIGTERHG